MKDAVIAERDLAKHTLDQLSGDLESVKAEKDSLQKDKDALQKELEERRDADEFEELEEESKREYEVIRARHVQRPCVCVCVCRFLLRPLIICLHTERVRGGELQTEAGFKAI